MNIWKRNSIENIQLQNVNISEDEKKMAINRLRGILKKNIHDINCMISHNLVFCCALIWFLIFLSYVDFFGFEDDLIAILAFVGTFVTISPLVLYYCKVPDTFLQYYIVIELSAFITLLGTEGDIGINITYALVPVICCLYFDRKMLLISTLISYVGMVIGVYFNSFSKYEVFYLDEPHMQIFLAYAVGFTIEYVMISIFLGLFASRASEFMKQQQEMLTQAEGEIEKYSMLIGGMSDIILEYDLVRDRYYANNSVYANTDEKIEISIENFEKYLKANELYEDNVGAFLGELKKNDNKIVTKELEFYDRKLKRPIWYKAEGRAICNDEGKVVLLIGKLHNITDEKIALIERERAKEIDAATGLYLYQYYKKRIEALEPNQNGLAFSIKVENFDDITEVYGYIYADTIIKKVADAICEFCNDKMIFCRLHGVHFIGFIIDAEYTEGFIYQKILKERLSDIYIGEKEPHDLKIRIEFVKTRAKDIDEELYNRAFASVLNENEKNRKDDIYNIFESTRRYGKEFTPEEDAILDENRKFRLDVIELLKYSKDLKSSINLVLSMIGKHFKLDRIGILEVDVLEGVNRITYQWCTKDEYRLRNFFTSISLERIDEVKRYFDEKGVAEVYIDEKENSIVADEENTLENVALGAQLLIPIIEDGEYTGTIFFDRKARNHYSTVEKFALSDITNILSAYINRLNSDMANKAKSSFLSNMSHEIRTPLNAIIGMTDVALREDMSEILKERLGIIKSSSVGLLSIINDILDLSKIESGKIEIVNEPYRVLSLLNDVNIIAQARNKDKNLEIILDISDKLPTILEGDMIRIKQVIVNFVNNAIKYTDKGSVKLKVDCEKIAEEYVDFNVTVSDTGQGIKEEDLSKIFQSFSQVDIRKNHYKEGTGLGLAICKQLVELMEGTINVNSVYEKGSEFSFTVRQRVVDATPAGLLKDYKIIEDDKKDECMNFTASKAKILIVDDNEINLEVAIALLEPLEMQIDVASNGREAFERIKEKKYDLVFMDHYMPVMDGIEATIAVRQLKDEYYQQLPIIALTADAVAGMKEHFIQIGMNDFVSKPIDLGDLCEKIYKWLPDSKIKNR